MPKQSKIAPATRRRWLTQYEAGERLDSIAEAEGKASRTVRDQVERARMETAFEVAQREQLRDALRSHQGERHRAISGCGRGQYGTLESDCECEHYFNR